MDLETAPPGAASERAGTDDGRASEGWRGRLASTVAYVPAALLAYWAANRFLTTSGVSVWFPPAALSLAYLVRVGRWGAVVVLATRLAAAVVVMDAPFHLGNAVATGALVVAAYALAADWLAPRFRDPQLVRAATSFGVAAGAAALAASAAAVGYVVATTSVPSSRLIPTVASFWLGDVAAVATLAPLLLVGRTAVAPLRRPRGLVRLELVAQLAAVCVTAWLAVAPDARHPQFYLTFVPLVWVALRWGLGPTTVVLAATGTLVPALGALVGTSPSDMTAVQTFMVVYAATGLLLGALETDRRRTGADLLLAEQRFRLSFEAAPIGIALVGLDGRFVRVNDALCKIVGYSADELVELTFQDVTHPEDLDGDLALVDDVLAGRIDGYTLEKRYLHRDGHHVMAQLDVSLVRTDDGAPLHFISQIQDITRRKEVLESLRAAEVTQRACLDALEQGVALIAVDGRVLLLNAAGQRILGYEPSELTELVRLGQWHTYREDGSLMPPEERPLVQTLLSGVSTSDREVMWKDSSGTLIALRVATEPVRDADGQVIGVVAAFADITQQRALEQAERDARERLEWQAFHDPLTGVANRARLLQVLAERVQDRRIGTTALLFLDLDRFKQVNDTMGHAAGDELLVAVAGRLERVVRDGDLVARLGGDEFVILASQLTDPGHAELLAARITAELAVPIELSRGTVEMSASIGIALDRTHDPDDLLRDADTALYLAKHSGRGQYELLR